MEIVSIKPQAETRPITILCIEDDKSALRDLTSILKGAGYRVFGAGSGDAAVKVFISEEIDLILSGLAYPGISGAELSIFMRQVRPEVSVIFLSGKPQIPAMLLKQVDGHVSKGAKSDVLLSCVERVLAQRPRDQGLRGRLERCG